MSREREDRKSEPAHSMCGSASISSLPHQSSKINKDCHPQSVIFSSGQESGATSLKSQQEQAQILDDAKLAEELQKLKTACVLMMFLTIQPVLVSPSQARL